MVMEQLNEEMEDFDIVDSVDFEEIDIVKNDDEEKANQEMLQCLIHINHTSSLIFQEVK